MSKEDRNALVAFLKSLIKQITNNKTNKYYTSNYEEINFNGCNGCPFVGCYGTA